LIHFDQIENKAKVDGRDFYGNSPLHIAAKIGDVSIVRHLIDKGANVNSKNFVGLSFLVIVDVVIFYDGPSN